MSFRIRGLDPRQFSHLFGLSEADLAARQARRCIADAHPGFPCRLSLEDAAPGESLLLLNFAHQPAATPYQASHAIFVREHGEDVYDAENRLPPALARRTLSLRAFDAAHDMIDARLVEGSAAEAAIEALFANPAIAYLQAHFAARGCFAATIARAD